MKRSVAMLVAVVVALAVASQSAAGPSEKAAKEAKKIVVGTIESVNAKHLTITLAAAPAQQSQTQAAVEQKPAKGAATGAQIFRITKTTIIVSLQSGNPIPAEQTSKPAAAEKTGEQTAAEQGEIVNFNLLKAGQLVRVVYAVPEHAAEAKPVKKETSVATQASSSTPAQQSATAEVPSKGQAQQAETPAVPPKGKHKEHSSALKGFRALSIEILK